MEPANQVKYSKQLIVQMDDFWAQFVAETHGLPIHFNDKREILTQIFDCYMDYAMNGPAKLQALPITNRIVDPVYENRESVEYSRLKAAVQNLVANIHARLQEIGGLRMGAAGSGYGFPYYVHQFLGNGDVILDHMPF
jgi:hypothetical protein